MFNEASAFLSIIKICVLETWNIESWSLILKEEVHGKQKE
ncbi:hypothetical protein BVRB_6g135780 [Beta vulgaris subsp. vulgaris]|nr:hypothetical protein BVRB_6g135780 [Beta vulgaris subsp. vulgaris]